MNAIGGIPSPGQFLSPSCKSCFILYIKLQNFPCFGCCNTGVIISNYNKIIKSDTFWGKYVTAIETFYYFYDINLCIVLSCFPQIDAELEYEGQQTRTVSPAALAKILPVGANETFITHCSYCAHNDISPNVAVQSEYIFIGLVCWSINKN